MNGAAKVVVAVAVAMTVVVGAHPTSAVAAEPSGSAKDDQRSSHDSSPTTRSHAASDAAVAQQARDRAAARERARAAASQQAQARARTQKRAAQLAAAGARARASWDSHARPNKLIIVRQRTVDVVEGGRLTGQVPRAGGALTLPTLDRFVPADWLVITDGVADLSAAIVLGPAQSLTLGGDVRSVRLAGGPTPSDAASIYTGHGRLALRAVTVSSYDAATQQPLPAGPGRPFIVVSGGGRIESVDSAVNDLGTAMTDRDPRAGLALGEATTGSLVRTTLARNTIGLKLDRTDAVRLEGVTVSGSSDDGLILRGDRATALVGVRSDGNGANGVLVTGPSSDRPITGISATGNKLFGIALLGQAAPQLNGVATADNTVGGVRVSSSTDTAVNDLTSTDDAIGIYTHVGSRNVVINRAQITGARRGLQIEKTTRGLTMNASTVASATISGISIGGHQIALNQVAVTDSATALRVERGAEDVAVSGLTMTGGQDGLVALSATKNVVLRNVVADGVARAAVRTFSSDLQILDSRISGSATGIDVGAATTITGTVITEVDEGIRARSRGLVDVDDAKVSALQVGINVAPGSSLKLAGSHVDALEAVRGTLAQEGVNDLSLPPLNLLGAIGLPLIVLALALEQIRAFRQRGSGQSERRLPPPAPTGIA